MTTTTHAVYPVSGKPIPTRFLKLDLRNEDLRKRSYPWTDPSGKIRHCARKNGRIRYLSHLVVERAGIGRPKGFVIDHINGDTMDDRLSNLRMVPQGVNLYNGNWKSVKHGLPRGVTKARGHFCKRTPFMAQILFQKKRWCEYFETAEEAHEAWKKKALELYGSLPYSIIP